MGVSALIAAAVASTRATPAAWMAVWIAEAAVGAGIAAWAIRRKARRVELPLMSGVGRKFLLSFLPAALAGGLLTLALYRSGELSLIPGMWLLLYGVAVVAAGTFSVRTVPVMGACFVALGGIALLASPPWGTLGGDLMMAGGFGGLHILFGWHIGRKHGG